MKITYYIITLLCSIIVLLELCKTSLIKENKKEKKEFDIGTCMTIGSREVQEDQVETLTTQAGTLAVLADGMGKAYGGRIASRVAVNTCVEIFKDYNAFHNPQYYFRKAFHCANREILKAVEDESRGAASIGCALIRSGYLYYAAAGNVKICVYREENLIPVSSGHTIAVLAEQRFKEGKISRQEALELLENHRLYNYLGKDGFQDIELFDSPVKLKERDIVVLMSDGIYELLGFKEIEDILKTAESCQKKALEIIELVNHNTSEEKDNASLILLEVRNGALV